jgi:flagellar biosynthesis protein FlhA
LYRDYPKLEEDLVPGQVSLGSLVSVLHSLLLERVSIRDLRTILESLSDQIAAGRDSKDVTLLAEGVRQSLGRTIVNPYLSGRSRQLSVISLDNRWEEVLQKQLTSGGGTGRPLALDPGMVQKLLTNLGRILESQGKRGVQGVLLVAPQARFGIKRLIERYFPSLPVLSPQEIPADISIQASDVVRYQEA